MASIGNANKLIQSDSFAERIDQIYSKGHYETQILRYEVLLEVFSKHFGNEIDGLYSSPGRIEICGNHTDHNNGKVLCAAVNSDTIGAVKKTDTGIIRIASQGFPVVKVDIKDMTYRKEEIGTSEALVRGIIRYMVDKGRKIGSFDCATISNIYKGAGVSSSAAFECLIIRILNDLFNDNEMHPIDIAKTAQFAESKYFGKPCGLMDQAAIAIGGVSYIDFEDEHNPVIRSMNWRFDITVVLINTGGDHSNLTSHYHSIKDEMSSIAEYYGYKSL